MRKLKLEELNRINIDEFKNSPKTPIVIVLDNIRSLNNIGSAFRTADAFLIEEIVLCGITAKPPHRDINKTALGATESVKWSYFETTRDAVLFLKNKNYKIIAIEQTDKSIMLNDFDFDKNNKLALIFGNEVNGIDDNIIDLIDTAVEIPQLGTKHSLNISVCVGIVVWDIYNKLIK